MKMRRVSGRRSRSFLLTLRLWLIMAFIGAMTLGAVGQTHYKANIQFGVKGGYEMSRVFFNPSVHQGLAPGFTAGVTFRYIEENHFGLIAELNLNQRGWKENFDQTGRGEEYLHSPYRYRRTLNYLSIPVLAHIYFGRRGRFFINAGPEISFFLGESTSANFDPEKINELPNFPIQYRTNSQLTMSASQKVDYGITAGLGGEFNINRRNSLALEARFYYGLGNVFPSQRRDVFSGSNQMSVIATVNYWFRVR